MRPARSIRFLSAAATAAAFFVAPAHAQWSADCSKAPPPSTKVAGLIRGVRFIPDRAELMATKPTKGSKRNTYILTIRSGKDFFSDYEYMVTLLTPLKESIAGKQFVVGTGGVFKMPGQIKDGNVTYPPVQGVMMKWKVPGKAFGDTDLASKFTMRLEFGSPQGGKVPGRIHISLRDAKKSWLAGAFTASLK